MYYAGIDISKKSFTLFILDEKGELVRLPHILAVNQED